MRQVLLNTGGAVVARVPRPIVEPGSVLVRVHYSLISVGTEIAPLRPAVAAAPDSSTLERGVEYATLARRYLRASLRDPRKAADRIVAIARRQAARLRPSPAGRPMASVAVGGLTWTQAAPAAELTRDQDGLKLITDDTPAGYQLVSQPIPLPPDHAPVVRVQGRVDAGAIAIGLLNEGGASWLLSRRYEIGPFEDTLIADPKGSREVTVAVTAAGAQGRSRVTLSTMAVGTAPKTLGGVPVSELDTQGWSVGYSAAGEVVAVGDGTGGRGADRTLITAATKSSAVVNLAMEVTRAKGTVVIVGDVGLKVERDVFYRKEIDLLMSTSYGPGRYDPSYEVDGHDYPFAYVRWTENRNMQSYLELLARGRIDVQPLVDRVISVDEAPSAYRALVEGG